MEELNTVISEYVQAKNTDYAIMINGKWGCGKSYYIANELDGVINKIQLPQEAIQNAQETNQKEQKDSQKRSWFHLSSSANDSVQKEQKKKTYTKAHISLYGITNVREFHRQILCGLHPILKNKWVGFVEYGIDKISQRVGLGGNSLDSKLLETNLNEYVMVFDDLERLSPELSVIDVMGWINSYTESQKCKVIIVCNEDAVKDQAELRGDSRYKEYLKYKEKTIRYTYAYESDEDKVYNALIANKKNETKAFYEKYKSEVLELFKQGGEKNLRTLIFILDCLYRVCQPAIEREADDEIIKKLIITFVVLAMENKKGATREQLNTIVQEEFDWSKMRLDFSEPGPEVMGNNNDDHKEETTKERIWKSSMDSSYISQMYRMPELIEFIVTGVLNTDELKESIERQVIESQKQQETQEGKLLKELQHYENINDEEFLGKISQLRANIEGNLYNMYELLDIYTILNRYHFFKIQGFKVTPEWDKIFEMACDKAAETHKYDSRFELCVPMWDPSDKSEAGTRYNRLKAYAIQRNNKCEQTDGKDEANRYIKAVKANDIETLREYRKREDVISLVYNMDWEKLWKLVISSKTTSPVACVVIDTIEYWVVRYGSNPKMWKPLYEKVKEHLSKRRWKNSIRVMYLYPLQSSLKERIYGR